MNIDEVEQLICRMRQIGKDTQNCEVKESVGKLPTSIVETLSAFSNGMGGVIILGLSESKGFKPAKGFSAGPIQDALVSAGEKLTPFVRPSIETFPFEDAEILVAEIYPMAMEDKPCYVTARGLYKGSFIRTGDGDRSLSHYEIDRLVESHRQPSWDAETIRDASIDELDENLVQSLVRRQKLIHPRIFEHMTETEVLMNLRVISDDNGTPRPTLAGLLALGRYPQRHFPTLVVTFTRYADDESESSSKVGEYRFLDNQTLVGGLPYLIADAVQCVRKNMKTGAVIDGAFRKEIEEYPLIAVREAVANALQHRDYSPEGRCSAVNINMYSDRLEIINPGGLYGRVTMETLGNPGITASRNQFLSSLLETTPYPGEGYVVENRGSGIRAIHASLDNAGMHPADIYSSLTSFRIIFHKRRRSTAETDTISGSNLESAILSELENRHSLSVNEIIKFSGCSRSTVATCLKKMVIAGKIEPTERPKSPKQRYRLSPQ